MSCIIHGVNAREENPGIWLIPTKGGPKEIDNPFFAAENGGIPARIPLAREGGLFNDLACVACRYDWWRLERVNGIEPSSSAWKAVALPLSYTRNCREPWQNLRCPSSCPSGQNGDGTSLGRAVACYRRCNTRARTTCRTESIFRSQRQDRRFSFLFSAGE